MTKRTAATLTEESKKTSMEDLQLMESSGEFDDEICQLTTEGDEDNNGVGEDLNSYMFFLSESGDISKELGNDGNANPETDIENNTNENIDISVSTPATGESKNGDRSVENVSHATKAVKDSAVSG